MWDILVDKFTRTPALGKALVGTAPATLVEGNTWKDTFWGVCKGVGENHLGRHLYAPEEPATGEGRMTFSISISKEEALALTLPGTVPRLLDGYVGPVLRHKPGSYRAKPDGSFAPTYEWILCEPPVGALLLPLDDPSARARAVEWAAQGERCACEGLAPACTRCQCTGWLRRPEDLRWVLSWSNLPSPEPWVSSAVLWVCVQRMLVGMLPIQRVCEWSDIPLLETDAILEGGCRLLVELP